MAKKDTTTVVSVKALVPVEYDGNRYQVGEPIDVRAEDLQQLLDVNAVEQAAAQ